MRINRSSKVSCFIFFLIFSLLFVCNMLTQKIVDDFAYMYSWDTGEKITSIVQIFPSIAAHAEKMNGRLVAHFFVQVFEMLPKVFFNVVNAALFVLLIYLMYKFSKTEKKNNLLILGLFGSVWLFVPAFGQVFLWLDGACNYSWSVVFGLIFLIPFVNEFLYNKQIKNIFLKILFVIFSFVAGAFSENVSAASMFIAGLIVLALIFVQHKKFPIYYIVCIGFSFLGYLSMVLAPAERAHKGIELTLGGLRGNFIEALEMYKTIDILLVTFVILLIVACAIKVQKERLILSVIFVAGSLCSNFLMSAAAYYPERCLLGSVIMLIIADGILLSSTFEEKYQMLSTCLLSIILLYTAYYVPIAVNDIYVSNAVIKSNEQYIYQCKDQGNLDITVPMPKPQTKYSAVYGLRYLSADTPDTWPNVHMSRYYEVNTILGEW